MKTMQKRIRIRNFDTFAIIGSTPNGDRTFSTLTIALRALQYTKGRLVVNARGDGDLATQEERDIVQAYSDGRLSLSEAIVAADGSPLWRALIKNRKAKSTAAQPA